MPARLFPALILLSLTACHSLAAPTPPMDTTAPPGTLRIATYNTSLYSEEAGGLVARLQGDDAAARKIAAVLQAVRPDVVLLNEFDFDPEGRAADLFQQRYLQTGQYGHAPLHYPYRYLAPVNTGEPSGLDLDQDGQVGGTGRTRGNDAWGYGLHPGQYGMLLLSRYPLALEDARTFRLFKWSALPGARFPRDAQSGQPWYPDALWQQLRLSSKSHWDVPVHTPQGVLHVLALHPTPPVFDGPENRNGARNHDEIRLIAEYIQPRPAPWLCDDQGRCGALDAGAHFVIAGDLNADPDDGDSVPGAVTQLLHHPRLGRHPAPQSDGAAERAAEHGLARRGNPRTHTGDFGTKTGTLRLDYVLPSQHLAVHGSGVFWPTRNDPAARFADASDHHLVWVDITLPAAPAPTSRQPQ